MTHSHTPEQLAILAHIRDTDLDLIIDAKAGSGKTKSLLDSLPLLRGTTSLQAFNRSIADDIKARVGRLDFSTIARTQVSTVHSHGLSAFRKAGRKPNTQGGKMHFILSDKLKTYPARDPLQKNARHVVRLASMAKNSGFGLTSIQPAHERYPAIADEDAWMELIEHFNMEQDLEGDISLDSLIEEAIELLGASNRRENMIDFDDMIYLPLLWNLPITRYDNVLLDEAQDINGTRRELAFRTLNLGGRMIAVGDPNQAIYGFTGASVDSLSRIARRCNPATPTLPLSICWRCDSAIISEAQKVVPAIYARPGAGEGQVSTVAFRTDKEDFLALPQPGDAILCRLNKPNVATALGLLRRGKPAKIEGRDLGKKLLDHVKKADDMYAHQPLSDTLTSLAGYRDREVQKLLLKERESAAALLEDEIDAAELLIERCVEQCGPNSPWPVLETLVASLFGDDIQPTHTITLSSVHKAKGREWPHVYILGRWDYMPFFRATAPWELEQEDNLIYVAITRAERALTYVTGVASALDKGLHREAPLALAAPAPVLA